MKKFLRSLLAKYMLIIFIALVLIQGTYIVIALIAAIGQNIQGQVQSQNSLELVAEKWQDEAGKMGHASPALIKDHFVKWKEQYPESSMFWVDENGRLSEQLDVKTQLPSEWTAVDTVKFIKERYGGNPFTVVSFVGKDENRGFIVFEIPRSVFAPPLVTVINEYGTVLVVGMISIILLFVLVSFLFFRGIRVRLLQLQDAMAIRDVDGLPIQVHIKKNDEISQLEQTFNEMVTELRESRKREQEEEQLRRELIANLSHDLRTPLTKIRAHTYTMGKEDLSDEGKQAIHAVEASIMNIDRLMENLLAYTLLMANKHQFEPKEVDVVRYVRECTASWYQVFEKEGFNIDVELQSFDNNQWQVDPTWLGRILDNVFQNVLRHANSGQYILVKTESTDQYDAIVITDRGKGFNNKSKEKGAGIGLAIIDMMVKRMKLDWNIESSETGTTILIKKIKRF